MKTRPFDSIIRNRRGAVCAVCTGLLFVVGVILLTWAAVCINDAELHPLPDGTCTLVALFLGTQFFKYRDDRIAEREKAAP